jgi:hypothetical protein
MSETQDQLNSMFSDMEETMQTILDAEQAGEEYEGQDPSDALHEFGYGVTKKTLVTLTLAGGGPSAWLDCECSADDHGNLELDSVTYHATWWGNTPDVRELDSSDALYQYAERIIEGMEA